MSEDTNTGNHNTGHHNTGNHNTGYRNTQGIHHAQQRARAATCAALKIELKRRKFEYKPTAREKIDGV